MAHLLLIMVVLQCVAYAVLFKCLNNNLFTQPPPGDQAGSGQGRRPRDYGTGKEAKGFLHSQGRDFIRVPERRSAHVVGFCLLTVTCRVVQRTGTMPLRGQRCKFRAAAVQWQLQQDIMSARASVM